MMPDEHSPDNATSDYKLREFIGRVGNAYVRAGLSPPTQLRDAVKHWLGLTPDEIVAVIEQHFDQHRHRYSGSGDGLFWMVESAVRKAIEAKYPVRPQVDPPERPPRRSSRVEQIHNASGFPDVLVEGRAARLVRRSESNVTRPFGLVGYEDAGDPISIEDNEGDA